jgi:hypothetical protein
MIGRAPKMKQRSEGAPFLLRLFCLLACAMVMAICGGVASHATRQVAETLDGTSPARATAPQPSHHWRDRTTTVLVGERDFMEADDDIDDDVDGDGEAPSEIAAPATRALTPCIRRHAFRDEPQVDTSRFAICRGLSRGPPV